VADTSRYDSGGQNIGDLNSVFALSFLRVLQAGSATQAHIHVGAADAPDPTAT